MPTAPKANWLWLSFSQLSSTQLYSVMQLRQLVFVVEQDCVYLDADDCDQNAWHVLGVCGDDLAAYCRVLKPGVKYAEVSIGRVVTAPTYRSSGLGKTLMQQALQCIAEEIGNTAVRISAQLYLKTFYQEFGFNAVSEPYDEDGIPHIEMLRPANTVLG